jgi:hypothetical protein
MEGCFLKIDRFLVRLKVTFSANPVKKLLLKRMMTATASLRALNMAKNADTGIARFFLVQYTKTREDRYKI